MDVSATRTVARRRPLTVPAVTGIAYTLTWIAGLAIPAPSPGLTASGAEITKALAGHQAAVAVQFALTEGLPAAGLAIVSVAIARTLRRAGAIRAARFAMVGGVTAALISLLQFVLGMTLAASTAPGAAHLLNSTIDRLDGVKMLALAALAVAGAASDVLPRWLRYAGIALAITISATGVGYLLLLPGPATLAYVSLPLLLLFITGAGVTLRTAGR